MSSQCLQWTRRRAGLSQVVVLLVLSTGAAVPLPAQDLVSMSIRPSGSPLRTGRNYGVQVEVGNAGTILVPSAWVIQVVLSQDSVIDAGDPVVGTLPVPSALKAGDRATYSAPLVVPLTMPSGWYFLGVRLDGTNLIPETNEANNTSPSQRIMVSNLAPDLVITSGIPAVSTGPLVPGQPISVPAWRTKNQGQGTAGVSASGVYLARDTAGSSSDILLGTVSVSSLPAGTETTSTPTDLVIPPETPLGTYYVRILVDRGGAVTEVSESNNSVVSGPIQIVSGTMDLVLVSGPLQPLPSAVAGQTLTLQHWVVENRGTLFAPSFTAGIYLSPDTVITSADLLLAEPRMPGLAPGSPFSYAGPVSVTIPATLPPRRYYLGLLLDRAREVYESNEANNSRVTSRLTVTDATGLSADLTAFQGNYALSPVPTLSCPAVSSIGLGSLQLKTLEVVRFGADSMIVRGDLAWGVLPGLRLSPIAVRLDGTTYDFAGSGRLAPPDTTVTAGYTVTWSYDVAVNGYFTTTRQFLAQVDFALTGSVRMPTGFQTNVTCAPVSLAVTGNR